MKLEQQVTELTRGYASKGGKDNRRQQVARMRAFARYCETQGAQEMGQVGGKHVVGYWRSLRAAGGLADATLHSHWLALCALWRLSGKAQEPPAPFYKDGAS